MTAPDANPSCPAGGNSLPSRSFSVSGPARPAPSGKHTIHAATRCGLSVLGFVLAGLLATALVLTPEARGFGTHRQLGLPDCTFVALLGSRCPSCGMTTSWSHLVRGQIGSALSANVGGTLLGVLAIGVAPWALVSAARGRWLLGSPGHRAVVTLSAVVLAVTLIDWLWRMLMQAG